MATSLEEYYNRIVYLNLAIYVSYVLIKYVLGPILLCVYINRNDGVLDLQWVVHLVFGKLIGTSDTRLPKISLNKTKKMSRHGQVVLLFVIIAAFVVLAVGTALDLSLFTRSHICSEDTRIDCYPQLISGANSTGLNISIDAPIQDCTEWNSEGISTRVTFICYQKEFNLELLLVATGGLLALAFYVMKSTIGALLVLTRFLTKKCKCHDTCPYVFRIIVAVSASVVEVVLVAVCLMFAVTGLTVDTTNDPPALMFLAMHAAEILVIFGITATLIWLPWEEYNYTNRDDSLNENDIELY